MIRKCMIGQSGGPTAVINASLAGIIQSAFQAGYDQVYGMVHGIAGLLEEQWIDLRLFQDEHQLKSLMETPSMYLGSCRFKIEPEDQALQQKIIDILTKHGITDFFYIGGNDSMDTIKILSHYAKKVHSNIHFMGVPKTIDNDLKTYVTPGYPSACHYVATTLLEVALDSVVYPQKAVTIVEIMGRDAGWLTASAQIVNEVYPHTVDLIYLPEDTFNRSCFIEHVQRVLKQKNHCMIAVSEGLHFDQEIHAFDTGIQKDAFGHSSHHGCSNILKEWVLQTCQCKVRVIQLSTLQRCAAHLVSLVDRQNAFKVGAYALHCALENQSGVMVSFLDQKQMTTVPIEDVANDVKKFPMEWIDTENKQIKKAYIDYIVPLIYESGKIELPHYEIRS